ncbi:MAG: MFS transporter, partial [Dehalococcoidia bacterium]|nr:MFS transporter [Dehalococcoidia bacterium]
KAGRRDVVGATLLAGSLFAFMGGFSGLGTGITSFSVATAAVLFAVSVVIMVVFLRRARRVADPLIEIEILTGRPYLASNVYNFLLGVGVLGVAALVPLYAVSVYGSSTLESGLILTPRSVGMLAASAVTSMFLVRWGYRWPMLVGSVVLIVSVALLGLEPGRGAAGVASGNIWWLLVIMAIAGVGSGIAAPAANNACIELMPERVSTITAIRSMFRQAGGAVSVTGGSLLLHVTGNIASGFVYLYLGIAALMLLMIPVVFFMPRGPVVRPKPAKEQGTTGVKRGA